MLTRGLPLWLVCAYVVVAPSFDLIGPLNAYDEKRALQLVIVIATCVWLVASKRARTSFIDALVRVPAPARLVMALVGSIGLLSALGASDPRVALLEVSHLTLLFAVAVAIAGSFATLGRTADELTLAAIAAAATIVVLDYCLLYFASLTPGDVPAVLPYHAFPNFSHVRFFGQWQTWTLPLLAAAVTTFAACGGTVRHLSHAALVLCSLWWALLFATGTRGSLLGLTVAGLAVVLIFRREARDWLRIFVGTAVAGVIIYAAAYLAVPQGRAAFTRIFEHVLSASSSGREVLWSASFDLIRARPLVGVGPQNYVLADAGAAHPHSSVLQLASEWGLAATVLMIAMAAVAMRAWCARPKRPHTDRGLEIGLTASLLAAAVHSLFSGILVMPLSQTMCVLVGGWVGGITLRERAPVRSVPSGTHAATVTALAVSAIALVVCAVPPAGRAWFERHEIAGHARERLQPRFWRRSRPPHAPPGASPRPR